MKMKLLIGKGERIEEMKNWRSRSFWKEMISKIIQYILRTKVDFMKDLLGKAIGKLQRI